MKCIVLIMIDISNEILEPIWEKRVSSDLSITVLYHSVY